MGERERERERERKRNLEEKCGGSESRRPPSTKEVPKHGRSTHDADA
jgi:hypothetical protein